MIGNHLSSILLPREAGSNGGTKAETKVGVSLSTSSSLPSPVPPPTPSHPSCLLQLLRFSTPKGRLDFRNHVAEDARWHCCGIDLSLCLSMLRQRSVFPSSLFLKVHCYADATCLG